ncbi:hypothetical protein GUITHDRAFT_120513 [Guillardia theta CCMP2712]|uniref:Uncharacterized protein n=1 Tax=Guillardia theta (strain CCMP2712) TaxID=905079 RepID=L1IBV5_GUITC|nr:hypothetical protein GUITHDRAFT_120513 [Guillardia theta CCMP2712]EKX33300.1 hypothetical protein GUITHDRAFT_120513 [Guillardia theta CCMP2712]|eukprot:XP_005820280.1 hypothetical protein GUITHDRAFT_120513 [Guillardia theta CCMP2712]
MKNLEEMNRPITKMRIKRKKTREWLRTYGQPTPHLTAVLHAVDNTGAADPVSRNPLLWNELLLDGEKMLIEMRHKLYLEAGSKSTRALSTRHAQNEREIQILDAAQNMLWSNAITNDLRGVRHLVKKVGIDVNIADPKLEQTVLWPRVCILLPEKETSGWLLRYGADPNARTVDGHTPLHWAASKGYGEVVRRLVRAGSGADSSLEMSLSLLAGGDLSAETYEAKAAIINGHVLLSEEIRDLAGIKHRAIR